MDVEFRPMVWIAAAPRRIEKSIMPHSDNVPGLVAKTRFVGRRYSVTDINMETTVVP